MKPTLRYRRVLWLSYAAGGLSAAPNAPSLYERFTSRIYFIVTIDSLEVIKHSAV